jgi:predicted Zn-dependent protease
MDPSALTLRRDINRTLLLAGKTPEAEQRTRETLALDSTNARTRMLLGQTLLVEGKNNEAVQELEHSQRELPTTRGAAFLAGAYFRVNREKDARRLVDSMLTASNRTFVPAMDLAIAYAGLRDKEQTLTWLERAYDDRTLRPFIRDQVFTFVRTEPRFRALIAKMKLPPVNCC